MNAAVSLAFAVGGWSLLGQFIFNRIIFFYVANSEYAAASIITLHLAGFWLGATLARRFLFEVGALLLMSAAITLLAEVLVWRVGIVWFGLPSLISLTAVCGIALAAASGATITRLMNKRQGGHAQHVFMADTAGSVLGAVVGGFWLIPHLGLEMAFHVLLLIEVLALTAWLGRKPVALGVAVVGVLMVASLQSTSPALAGKAQVIAVEGMPVASKGVSDTLVYASRSPYGLVSVTGRPDFLMLNSDSRLLCSVEKNKYAKASEWRMAVAPVNMIAHGGGRQGLRAANVGLGCGITLAALLDSPAVAHADVVELNPVMPDVQKAFWPLLPKHPDDPRAAVHIEDGFGYFAERKAAAPKYDIVALDVAWMQNMNATHLFSEEMYENVRRAMADDGIFSVWIEENSPFSRVSLISYKTLKEVFPNVAVSMVDGVVVFYASPTRADLANYLSEEDGMITVWVEDAAADAPVNRLDDLVMNRSKFTASGDSTWEKLRHKYADMRKDLEQRH